MSATAILLAAAILAGAQAVTDQAATAYVNDGRCYNGLGQNEGFIPVGYEQVPPCGSAHARWPVRDCSYIGPWSVTYIAPNGDTYFSSIQVCRHS